MNWYELGFSVTFAGVVALSFMISYGTWLLVENPAANIEKLLLFRKRK